LIAVISGCLGSFGIGYSTLSAHQARGQETLFPPFAGAYPSPLRRSRGRQAPSESSPDDICASYSRYSSDNQRDATIETQQRQCREAGQRNGHVIRPELEFFDKAVSGTKLHREGLDAQMKAAEEGKFQVLYFYNLSRLARESVISMPMLKKLVYVYGVRIISVTEGIDSARDGWDLIASFCSLMHEQHIKILRVNVFSGQETALLANFSVGDYCFGYASVSVPGSESARRGRNSKPRMAYIIDEQTAIWVIRIFSWFVHDKRSVRWITRELNRLGAPKDHRSSTPHWHHQQVTQLLKNSKYIGVWPWGRKKNVRNPLTGDVRQEERPYEESKQWTRKFEHLRIISDADFEAAQKLLEANERRTESRRRPDGRLGGSQSGNARTQPRHLLSRLLQCGPCGSPFQVAGNFGKYLGCPKYGRGLCQCKTKVRRELAERLILRAVSERILADVAWKDCVRQELHNAWKVQQEKGPSEIQAAEKAVDEARCKVGRLLDSIENGVAGADIKERLAERRKDLEELEQTLRELQSQQVQPTDEPSEEWMLQQIHMLHTVLSAGGPAAALALRELVGGAITVTEVRLPGRKRCNLQARFLISTGQALRSLASANNVKHGAPMRGMNGCTDEIVLNFVEPDPCEALAPEAKRLFDMGLKYTEIATHLKCSRNQVTKALAIWYRKNGQEPPDGRSCRKRLDVMTRAKELAEPAKALLDQDLLMQDIANRLDCDRDTVTKAIQHWYRSRGLEPPDGRARRKSLERKVSDPPGLCGDNTAKLAQPPQID
jgi:hypothetical protein